MLERDSERLLTPSFVLGPGVVAKAYGYPVVFLATGVLVWSAIAFVPKKALGLSA